MLVGAEFGVERGGLPPNDPLVVDPIEGHGGVIGEFSVAGQLPGHGVGGGCDGVADDDLVNIHV